MDTEKKYGIGDITEKDLCGKKRQQTIEVISKSGILENDIIKSLFLHLPDPVLYSLKGILLRQEYFMSIVIV